MCKRCVIFFLMLFFLSQFGCNCDSCNYNKLNSKKNIKLITIFSYDKAQKRKELEEQKQELIIMAKKMLLPNFSNDRVFPDVASEVELLDKLIEDAFNHPQEFYNYYKNEMWQDANFGDLILIEDYTNSLPGNLYYYMITAVNDDGFILAMSYVFAMANNPNMGKFGSVCDSSPNTIPMRYLKSQEVVQYFKDKYNILEDVQEVKAVCLCSRTCDYYDWGWAIKLKNPISVTTVANEIIQGNVFFVNPVIYDMDWLDDKPTEKRNEFMSFLMNYNKLSLISQDIFDNEIIMKIRALNQSSPKELIESIYPKLIHLEYYIK